jgi:hypothetical protein
MISIYFPSIVTTILSSLGFIFLSLILHKLLIFIEWKIFKNSKPQSPLEYKAFLLEKENENLKTQITNLEQENSKFVNLLIKHM